MKRCRKCSDTSPTDAAFCIGCGRSFAQTGATERLEIAPSGSSYSVIGDLIYTGLGSAPYWTINELREMYGYGALGSASSIIVKVVP